MPDTCVICNDSGFRLIERPDGSRAAIDCECRVERRATRQMAAAKIPKRYLNATLNGFETKFIAADKSLGLAHSIVTTFAGAYPAFTEGKGLLLRGPNGTGKTTLAISLLKALIERGFQGLFVTYGELLKQVQNSYNPSVQQTELDVLRPVFDAEILVIDELGGSKPTEWVLDTVSHILNSRYNDQKTTIITTNFANERELLFEPEGLKDDALKAWRATYKATLGDRIGERMRSRLQEMCVVVEMRGVDFRQSVKRAEFGDCKVIGTTLAPREAIVAAHDRRTTSALKEDAGEDYLQRISSSQKSALEGDPLSSESLEWREVLAVRKRAEKTEKGRRHMASREPEEEEVVGGARLGSAAKRLDVSGSD